METDDDIRRLVLLDTSTESPIAKLLTAGVQIYNNSAGLSGNSGSLHVDITPYKEFAEPNLDGLRDKIILSFVGEMPLSRIVPVKELRPMKRSSRVNTRQPAEQKNLGLWRAPSSSLEFAQRLAAQNASKRIFLVVPSDPTTFSGLDITAALIAGFAGVVDIHSLISRESLGEIVLHQPVNRWHRSMLLVGTHLVSEIYRV